MREFSRSHPSTNQRYKSRHRFEHWYRDRTVYFITARCHDRFHAFATEASQQVFWDRFQHYSRAHGFTPWITSLLSNHYHSLGYLERGVELKEMMRKLHGSVAKMVNDLLPARRVPFWGVRENRDYFDGCLRTGQLEPTYRYVLFQCRRHGICADPSNFPGTRVELPLDEAVEFARRNDALVRGIPYPRYDSRKTVDGQRH